MYQNGEFDTAATSQVDTYGFLQLPKGIISEDQFVWNNSTKQLTFTKSVSFSGEANHDNDLEGFYYEVPVVVKEILIEENVTVEGGFRVNESITIKGADRQTSKIFGTDTKRWALGENGKKESTCKDGVDGDDRAHDCAKWKYSAVAPKNYRNSATIRVESLTIENSRTYAITSFKGAVMVDDVHIVNSRPLKTNGEDYQSNSDGIVGGPGTIISNTRIDTWDDAIKLYHNTTVRNVTIVHNQNGAPFQLGWTNKEATEHVIENVKIEIPQKGRIKSNLALVSASLKNGSVDAKIRIKGVGLYADYLSRSGLKIRTGDALPWIWLKSKDAKLTMSFEEGASIYIKSPGAVMGEGSVNFENFCSNVNELSNTVECGNENVAIGAPF